LEPGTAALFQVPGSRFRSAKGETRTPIPFREPDPKSGASASSATFAFDQTITSTVPGGDVNGAMVRGCDGARVRTVRWCEGPHGAMVRWSAWREGPDALNYASRRPALSRALAIFGRTVSSTFEMMSSSTGPRAEARELIARLAGTRLIVSCTFCASTVV
jgi:hypothetical protein